MSVLRDAAPELAIAAVAVAATAAAGYAMAGGAGAVTVAVAAAVAALIVIRSLLPAGEPDDAGPGDSARPNRAGLGSTASSMTGYWRQRFTVSGGIARQSAYEAGLRRTLEHLLSARLAERHGINLYEDPAAARRLLCGNRRDDDLWYWIDPRRPPEPAGPAAEQHGIPERTLRRLLDRLEQL